MGAHRAVLSTFWSTSTSVCIYIDWQGRCRAHTAQRNQKLNGNTENKSRRKRDTHDVWNEMWIQIVVCLCTAFISEREQCKENLSYLHSNTIFTSENDLRMAIWWTDTHIRARSGHSCVSYRFVTLTPIESAKRFLMRTIEVSAVIQADSFEHPIKSCMHHRSIWWLAKRDNDMVLEQLPLSGFWFFSIAVWVRQNRDGRVRDTMTAWILTELVVSVLIVGTGRAHSLNNTFLYTQFRGEPSERAFAENGI